MARDRTSTGGPSRTQLVRAAAARAVERVGGGEARRRRALALVVLRLAVERCAEIHHPGGRGRVRFALAEIGEREPHALSLEDAAISEVEAISGDAPAPDPYELGAVHEAVRALAPAADGARGATTGGDARRRVVEAGERRRAGAHYTPAPLAREVVERALGPLLGEDARPEDVLALRVCDASTGAGAFLLAACEVLARRLTGALSEEDALRAVAGACLFGVDRDPTAVTLARLALWIATRSEEDPRTFLRGAIRAGDTLVGPPHQGPPWPRGIVPFDWEGAFPEVLGGRGGFDAIVGNPPWVSYAGRAAQPLDPELFELYARSSPAFFGYRNLQGLFVHRTATLLRPGGRLGLVVPTSMSDLGGYEPSRRAHDGLCVVDAELPDFGDRFEGVFQPCMGLLSTRRAGVEVAPAAPSKGRRSAGPIGARAAPWPLERRDLDARSRGLLARLDGLPKVPAEMFGERGFQSTGDDRRLLSRANEGEGAAGEIGLRVGSDVGAFRRKPPSYRCDPRAFGARFRSAAEWGEVRVLIRQTARFPMACLSDGLPFRNSVLAGFETEGVPAGLLVAYLCSAPVRWFHYVRHRDARQGMPQIKIVHLRSLPAPRGDAGTVAALAEIGALLAARNDGARPEEQCSIDDLAGDLLGLDAADRAIVTSWAATVR